MSWYETALAAVLPAADLLLPVLGLPLLVLGLVKLLVLPLALCFEVLAVQRHRKGAPTLFDEWPTVSIIVPAFNAATVIENCVRSIQLTRYDRYEVVLVDDGSTDNTAELMRGLAAADPRITVLSQANDGKAAALNLWLGRATGDVLMFADADGLFTRDTVKRMLQGFPDKKTGAVCGADRPINLNRAQTRRLAFVSQVGTGMARRAVAVVGCLPAVCGNIGAVRRSVIEEIGLFRGDTMAEVLELTWRVRRAGYRVGFAPSALVHTEPPSTIGALWRHRVRRARGLLQTIRVHKDMTGHPRKGFFGACVMFSAMTVVAAPVLQIVLLADLALLLAAGRSPLSAEVWALIGWVGLAVTVVLTLSGLALNRAWRDLRHIWALPLVALYPLFTALAMVAAVGQETRGKRVRRNKVPRTGAASAPAAGTHHGVRPAPVTASGGRRRLPGG